jgi:hypothetical protein
VARSWSALVLGSLTLLFTSAARAEEPALRAEEPVVLTPPPFVAESPPSSARRTLVLSGAAVFAVWYGAAVGESFLWPDAPDARQLRIPVAGPWMTLAHAGCGAGEANCSDWLAAARAIIAGITGVAQAGGLAAIAEAAFLRTDDGAPRAMRPARTASVQSVTLVTGNGSVGLGLSGSF